MPCTEWMLFELNNTECGMSKYNVHEIKAHKKSRNMRKTIEIHTGGGMRTSYLLLLWRVALIITKHTYFQSVQMPEQIAKWLWEFRQSTAWINK